MLSNLPELSDDTAGQFYAQSLRSNFITMEGRRPFRIAARLLGAGHPALMAKQGNVDNGINIKVIYFDQHVIEVVFG